MHVYADAVTDGVARIGAASTGPATLYVFDGESLERMAHSADLALEELRASKRELEAILTAHAGGASADAFVRVTHSHSKEGEQEDEESLRRKFGLVAELFDTETLRQRSWVKFTSKSPNFYRLDWEVLEKIADDDYSRPEGEPVRFALMQLKTQERGRDGELSETVTTFAVDSIDVEIISRGLDRLLKSLHRGEGADD